MAPVTQLGLVLLTTASVALAHRGHHGSHLHRNRRRQQHYNQNNSTTTDVAGPTGATAVLPDLTLTRTETRTSTVTSTVYEDAATASTAPAALFDAYTGSAAPTCGGTIYVTVTATATVTAGVSSTVTPTTSAVVAPSAPVAAYPSIATTTTTTATTAVQAVTTPAYVLPSSPAIAAAPPASTSTSEAPVVVASPAPSAYSPPAVPVPSDTYSAAPASSPASSAYASVPVTPSSSSAPAASSSSAPATGGQLRTKRGCLYNTASDCSILGDSTISWATNWASSADGTPGDCTFVPQLWGHKNSDGSVDFTANWAANAAAAIAAGAPAILGYNEPDLASQANLSPADGAALWSTVAAFQGQATIVSPAVTSTQQGDDFPGLDWLSSFKSAGASWDATAVHFYGTCTFDTSDTASYTDQVSYLTKMVDQASSRFGKPVWVTELGCNSGATPDQVAAFFRVALPYLEGEANVHQYAAFKADLLITDGAPNAAGSTYMKIAGA